MITFFKNLKRKEAKVKESKKDVSYRMYKECRTIEFIMEELHLERLEVIKLIREKKKERRGE